MLGPNNFMARAYQQIPIAITVEGANILTRSLIVFGQGAIRCHPYVLKEIEAAKNPDARLGLRDFDAALFGHVKFAISNFARSWVMGMTGASFVRTPEAIDPRTKRYYQQLTRMSASFAFVSDVSMLVLGGGLKRREKLSARLGDVLSAMYLCSAALKRYEGQGRHATDAPLLHWAIWDTLYHAQNALDGAISNYPNRLVAWGLRRVVYPLGRMFHAPSDNLGARAARILIEPATEENRARDRLTAGMYIPKSEADPIGALEAALTAAVKAEAVEAKLRVAARDKTIAGADHAALVADAAAKGIVTLADQEALTRYARLRDEVVKVDDFPQDFGLSVKVQERAAA